MTFTCLLLHLRMNRLNMHIFYTYAFILSKPDVQQLQIRIYLAVVMKILCNMFMQKDSLVSVILYFTSNVCLYQAFPREQNYGSIIVLHKGASSVMQDYTKLSTYASLPSILQESLRNSRWHKSPFKSHYWFLPNVLGLSRWFTTPPLMDFLVLLRVRTFFPNTRKKHIGQ